MTVCQTFLRAPMGARRDEEPSFLGTPLVAQIASYGRVPYYRAVVGSEHVEVASLGQGGRRSAHEPGVRG
jgi:hypothetical protein